MKIKSKNNIVDDNFFDGFLYVENSTIVEISKTDKKSEVFYD